MVNENMISKEDLNLIRSIENIFDDKKKFSEFVSLIGDKKCYENLVVDTKFENLVNMISKIQSPSMVMNDKQRMSEVTNYINNNECLRGLFNDKVKIQKLSALLGDTKVLMTFHSLMNSTSNRIPRIITYIKTDRAINQQLAGNQLAQIVDIFGYSCIQSLIKDKNKVGTLMNLVGTSPNPASLMTDPKKASELIAIFDGTNCLSNIMGDANRMQRLTSFLSDSKNIQSLQSTIQLWASGQMRKKRQASYTGKYVAPKGQNQLPTVDSIINKALVDFNANQKLENLQVPRQDFMGENYPQIFRELIKNKTIPATKEELQKLYDNNMNKQRQQQILDDWNRAYGADFWNQMGKESWNPINDQNWNNQMGAQKPWFPMNYQNWNNNQMPKQPMNPNWNPNWNNQMGGQQPWNDQNWNNQMSKQPMANNQMGGVKQQPTGPNWNQIENSIRG